MQSSPNPKHEGQLRPDRLNGPGMEGISCGTTASGAQCYRRAHQAVDATEHIKPSQLRGEDHRVGCYQRRSRRLQRQLREIEAEPLVSLASLAHARLSSPVTIL